MSGRGLTKDSLNHLLESLQTRLARAIRFRVMQLRRLTSSDRSMRAGDSRRGAIEAVVWDEYRRFYADYKRESGPLNNIVHLCEDQPVLTEVDIRRLAPLSGCRSAFHTKGTFEQEAAAALLAKTRLANSGSI
jgi:hypothetical protein